MAGRSEEDRRRMVARYQQQSRHFLSREEELERRQAAKARKAGRSGPPQRRRDDEDDPIEVAPMRAPARVRPDPARHGIDHLPRGTVTSVHAGRVEVDFAPARLGAALATDPDQRLAVGDEVAVEATEGPPRIRARMPRRSQLVRPDPGNGNRELVLAANVDLAVIVVAAADPPLRPGLIDRFLVVLQRGGVAPLLCVNKVDRLDAAARRELATTLQPYEHMALPTVSCSVVAGIGIDALRERLRGRTCVFVGHSGVGKSSLLNALDPHGDRAVGEVRAHGGKGRHTTTSSCLRELGDGTRVIDTPGIRALGVDEPTRDELRFAFPDVHELAVGCRFRDCRHLHEPDCAVQAAVADGRLAPARLASWQRLSGDGGPS